MTREKKSRGRQKFLPLVPVSQGSVPGDVNREQWLAATCAGFVSTSGANKEYYRVVLEVLWPTGHGIPGPYVTTEQLRDAVNVYRLSRHQGGQPYKPYIDVFRRVRELQGEEGVVGIGREGNTYQLVDLTLGKKRKPRTKLMDDLWEQILAKAYGQCAVCGRGEPEVRLEQDHKIPRVRSGGDEEENWQPLCGECNNFKSTSCRGCKLDCTQCSWAFPEEFAPLRLSAANIQRIRAHALEIGVDPHDLLNQVVAASQL
ncbi:HNH endonuclease [Anthocerotibacter panamensis]|uniref:HNH endonuclease n=1 Tax=Anthocerotibacter panamensis TaxID=2857077 RepID=UPI001C402135|nr:HNH endonuclease signature motif containing protein [Anthocerotibacter panamensis]